MNIYRHIKLFQNSAAQTSNSPSKVLISRRNLQKTKPPISVGEHCKRADVWTMMLQPQKLADLFKCMDPKCDYTTNNIVRFESHIKFHRTCVCPYCGEGARFGGQLVAHVMEKHSHCKFMCSACFYRSVSSNFVEHHMVSHFSTHLNGN